MAFGELAMEIFNETQSLLRLGAGISQRRISLNLTQQELAAQAGISKRTLERLESGLAVQTSNLLAVLYRLDLLRAFLALVPGDAGSPIQRVRALHREAPRQRVRKPAETERGNVESEWTWGDER